MEDLSLSPDENSTLAFCIISVSYIIQSSSEGGTDQSIVNAIMHIIRVSVLYYMSCPLEIHLCSLEFHKRSTYTIRSPSGPVPSNPPNMPIRERRNASTTDRKGLLFLLLLEPYDGCNKACQEPSGGECSLPSHCVACEL